MTRVKDGRHNPRDESFDRRRPVLDIEAVRADSSRRAGVWADGLIVPVNRPGSQANHARSGHAPCLACIDLWDGVFDPLHGCADV